jgi:Flp pilus assembly protein TadD
LTGGAPARRWEWAALALLLATTALAYAPALDGPFVLDDPRALRDARVSSPLEAPWAIWRAAPRPLLVASLALNHAVGGLSPRGYHLVNVGIHLAAILLAWRLARRLLARAGMGDREGRVGALLAAALFALHPLQAEAVAYVVQRGESLASAFYLAGLAALLARDEEEAAGRRGRLLLAAFLFQLLGLAAKPIAATLPLAWLLAAALVPVEGERGIPVAERVRRRLLPAAPLVLLSVGAATRTLLEVRGGSHAGFSIPGLGAAEYLATQLRVIPSYLRLLAWPVGQCTDWTVAPSGSFLEPAVVGGAIVLGLLAVGVVQLRAAAIERGSPLAPAARLAPFGAAFFLVALLPSSSVIPLIDTMVEHRVYLPALGLFLPVAAAVAIRASAERSPWRRRTAIAGAALLLAGFGAATVRRSLVWSSPLAVFGEAARPAGAKARAHANLGLALLGAGRDAEAAAEFRRALARTDDRTVARAAVLHDLVMTLVGMGRSEEALEVARATAMAPEEQPVADALHGWVRTRRGEGAEGLREIEAALAKDPREPRVLALQAAALFAADRFAEAVAAGGAGVEQDPDNRVALRYLGMASARRGDLATARSALLAAATLGGGDDILMVQLAGVEAALDDVPQACWWLGEALATPGNAFVKPLVRAERLRLRCR